MKKLLKLLCALNVWMVLAVYISSLLGSRFFLLPVYERSPEWVDRVVSLLLLGINNALAIGYATELKPQRCVLWGLLLSAVAQLASLWAPNAIIATMLFVLPILPILCLSTVRTQAIVRYLVFYACLAGFQLLTAQAKLNTGLGTPIPDGAVLAKVCYQVDSVLFAMSLYFTKGGGYYDTLESCMVSQDFECPRLDTQDREALAELSALRGRKRTKALVLLGLLQVLPFLLICLCGYIGNKLLETAIAALSFSVFGLVIHRRWHCWSVTACTVISAVLFFVAGRILPPFSLSQLLPVVCGGLVAFGMYLLDVHVERYEAMGAEIRALEKEVEALARPDPFCCKTATLDVFEARCRICGLDKRNTSLAIDGLSCDRLTAKEIAIKYGFANDKSARQQLRRLRTKLEAID